jgi:hypothetical protein
MRLGAHNALDLNRPEGRYRLHIAKKGDFEVLKKLVKIKVKCRVYTCSHVGIHECMHALMHTIQHNYAPADISADTNTHTHTYIHAQESMAEGVCTFAGVQLQAGQEGLPPELQELLAGNAAPIAIIEAILAISLLEIPPACMLVFDFQVYTYVHTCIK